VEDDHSVENLHGEWIHPRGAHGKACARGDPAAGVVASVIWLPGRVVLLLQDLDTLVENRLLDGQLPLFNAVADRLAVLEGDVLLEIEANRLLGRRLFGRGVRLFEVPAVDVTDEAVFLFRLREILDLRQKVTNAVVGQSGLVARV